MDINSINSLDVLKNCNIEENGGSEPCLKIKIEK
jgi:hypothetical protein